MQIGIVSIYGYENFGNRLQNYALQQILLKYADEVITIRNRARIRWYLKDSARGLLNSFTSNGRNSRIQIKNRSGKIFTDTHIYSSSRNYCYFRRKRPLKMLDRCDLYCAGSDQIWNPLFGRSGLFNYLDFADYDRTFSYAASFGIDAIPPQHLDAVRNGLNHIKYISVREEAGKRIVQELTGRTDVQVLVDPTMLLTADEWDIIAEKPRGDIPERYILTYFLGNVSDARRAVIVQKAQELGCAIIELMDPNSPFYAIGPEHFVYLIKHAVLVCTDSFHGSVFSFLYGKPLAIFERTGNGEDMSSRLITLTDKFSLKKCVAVADSLPDISAELDYSNGYAILEQERSKSKAYFDMILREAERAGLCK